jgi:hypothetical protein
MNPLRFLRGDGGKARTINVTNWLLSLRMNWLGWDHRDVVSGFFKVESLFGIIPLLFSLLWTAQLRIEMYGFCELWGMR